MICLELNVAQPSRLRVRAASRCPTEHRAGRPISSQRHGLCALSFCALFFGASTIGFAADGGIADRPEKLSFPPLSYEPPSPEKFRVQLKAGPVAYVMPDRELPLVSISVLVHTGEY